ncbi:MAG: AAA family ATPase [Candidatus Paceibacterota bacterium]
MSKIVIGLAGQIASGKDTVADYVKEKYGGVTVSFSQPMRDILKRLYLPVDRAHLVKLTEILIANYGSDILSKTIATEIEKSDKQIFILPNIRRESDYAHLSSNPGFLLVGINTDAKIRYERLVKRSQNEDDKNKTWEQFQKDALLSTEVTIAPLIEKSKFQLDNNGSLEDLYKQVDDLLSNKL